MNCGKKKKGFNHPEACSLKCVRELIKKKGKYRWEKDMYLGRVSPEINPYSKSKLSSKRLLK